MPNWPLEMWRMNATEQARPLVHTPAFSYIWRMCVLALHDLGECYLELHGEQVDRFLADLPNAASFRVGEPHAEAATSARRSGVRVAAKVADAASGVPRPTTSLPSAGVPLSEVPA
jgi:hypothetical protein